MAAATVGALLLGALLLGLTTGANAAVCGGSIPCQCGDTVGSTGTMSVTIPPGTTAGSYFLLACADDAGQVIENIETNNCRASTGQVTVTVGP